MTQNTALILGFSFAIGAVVVGVWGAKGTRGLNGYSIETRSGRRLIVGVRRRGTAVRVARRLANESGRVHYVVSSTGGRARAVDPG